MAGDCVGTACGYINFNTYIQSLDSTRSYILYSDIQCLHVIGNSFQSSLSGPSPSFSNPEHPTPRYLQWQSDFTTVTLKYLFVKIFSHHSSASYLSPKYCTVTFPKDQYAHNPKSWWNFAARPCQRHLFSNVIRLPVTTISKLRSSNQA